MQSTEIWIHPPIAMLHYIIHYYLKFVPICVCVYAADYM